MAQPTEYERQHAFDDFQTDNPNDPLPADWLESELNALKTTTDEIRTVIAAIQRDDTKLANDSVHIEALSAEVLALIGADSVSVEGDWTTATDYEIGDLVEEGGVTYVATVAHTAGTFSTDKAAGKWLLWAGVSGTAADIDYDNSGSGLAATDVKAALDELDGDVDTHVTDNANPHSVTAAQAGALATANDLSDLADAAQARVNLGIEIGVDVLAFSSLLSGISVVTQAEAEAGTATTQRLWTAKRVKQAIDALASSAASVPSGSVFPYAGSAAPSGYLLCAGQAVSRTTYSDLYSAIGTAYGNGDGSTTFNLPDLRGRVAVGKDNMNSSDAGRVTSGSTFDGDTLGATGGAEEVTLTEPHLAPHDHPISPSYAALDSAQNDSSGGMVNTYAQSGGSSTSNAGSGNAHNNMPPGIILNYVIKT